jgi:hypothetical protein
MNALVAVCNLLRLPLDKFVLHQATFADGGRAFCLENRAEQIRNIVKQTGLTMTQISAATIACYGKKTPFFVPPTFLYKQKEGVTPHACQILALSQVTGYRFADWLRICGFDLGLILAIQLQIHVERTVLVTPDHAATAFRTPPAPWNATSRNSSNRYLFAKIGSSDAVVYPEIFPGSVVRADVCYSQEALCNSAKDALWLVEHPGGLTCCHVERLDDKHILLHPNRPPSPAWPLHLNVEAQVLGLVDLELRPREASEQSVFLPTKFDHRPIPPHSDRAMSFSRLIRVSRSRAGLTLRAAHNLTRAVARLLGNRDFGIALGQLSDYEATDRLPRHVSKVMSLCIVYGIDPFDLMATVGIRVDDCDKMPLSLPKGKVCLNTSARLSNRYFGLPRDPESEWEVGKSWRAAGRASRDRVAARAGA